MALLAVAVSTLLVALTQGNRDGWDAPHILTLLAIAADSAGWLSSVEFLLYDADDESCAMLTLPKGDLRLMPLGAGFDVGGVPHRGAARNRWWNCGSSGRCRL